MTFHQLALSDREAMQAVTLPSGRRNCNYTFANLVGWQFWYYTEVCVLENTVVLRYTFDGQRAYMVCTSEALSLELIEALLDDSNFSFIVAEEYRGTRLNYDMLMSIMPELKTQYDFIFIPVLHRLKTHQYWQRWGAKEFYRDEDCVDYKLDI